MTRLAGKRIVVTGASGAFGRAAVARLRERGARVVGLDLVPDRDETMACDVTDDASVAAAVAAATERLEGLDVLVNNAGVGGPVDAGAAPDEHARRIVEVNLMGAWRVTAAAIPALVESRGRVVFVGSRMAHVSVPLGAAYAVSKRGLTAYADTLRVEYGTHLSVVCVHPSMVRTPIHDAAEQAGLSLQGVSRAEPLEGVVAKIVQACEMPRPPRELATTRRGAFELFVGRHLPSLAERGVRRVIRRQVAEGSFDGAPLASGLKQRFGGAGRGS